MHRKEVTATKEKEMIITNTKNMFDRLINLAEPLRLGLITILTFTIGSMLGYDKSQITENHIDGPVAHTLQDEITFYLQATAFIVTIIVGLIALWKFFKKKNGKRKSEV